MAIPTPKYVHDTNSPRRGNGFTPRVALLSLLGGVAVCVAVACGGRAASSGGGGSDTSTDWVRMCQVQSECDAADIDDLACECGICTSECTSDDDCTSLSPGAVCATTPDACGGRRVCAPPAFDSWEPPMSSQGTGEGDVCTPRNDTCGEGLACAASSCDDQGTCTPTSGDDCPGTFEPVCGCDGTTYGNSCAARTATIDYDGRCIGSDNACIVAIDASECCGEVIAASQARVAEDECVIVAAGATLADVEALAGTCLTQGCPEIPCAPLEVRQEIDLAPVHAGGGVCELREPSGDDCVVGLDTSVCCTNVIASTRSEVDADPCLLDRATSTVEDVRASESACQTADQCAAVDCAFAEDRPEWNATASVGGSGACELTVPNASTSGDACVAAYDVSDCCAPIVAATGEDLAGDPCLVATSDIEPDQVDDAIAGCTEPDQCFGALCVPVEDRWETASTAARTADGACELEVRDGAPVTECVVAVNQWECCSPIIAVDARIAAADECVVDLASVDPETSFDAGFCGLPCPAECTAPQSRPEYGMAARLSDGECVLERECTDNSCSGGLCDPREGCTNGLVCQAASCDEEGRCAMPWPQECTAERDPVCGCDGTTLSNRCTAGGAAIDHEGACTTAE